MSTDRPRVRRGNVFGPPADVRAVMGKATRNPRGRPVRVEEPKPRLSAVPAPQPVAAPARPGPPDDDFEMTQQDAIDLVHALTEAIEGANANVQRWHEKGDHHRMEAALTQVQRFEALRHRMARQLTRLARKG